MILTKCSSFKKQQCENISILNLLKYIELIESVYFNFLIIKPFLCILYPIDAEIIWRPLNSSSPSKYEYINDLYNKDFYKLLSKNNTKNILTYNNEYLYFRNINILVMKNNNIYYYIKDNKYYKNIDNIETIDDNKTFIDLNKLIYYESKILVILNAIADIINNNRDNYIKLHKTTLILSVYNLSNNNYIEKIDLSYFFVNNNNLLKPKNIWEFYFFTNDYLTIIDKITTIIKESEKMIHLCKDLIYKIQYKN